MEPSRLGRELRVLATSNTKPGHRELRMLVLFKAATYDLNMSKLDIRLNNDEFTSGVYISAAVAPRDGTDLKAFLLAKRCVRSSVLSSGTY